MEKRKKVAKGVDAYIASHPVAVQRLLKKLRSAIHRAAPGVQESISYGIPTFALDRKRVHFAAYEGHVGFYPGAEPLEVFAQELAPFALGKGTVRFPLDRPLPLELVARMVKFRLAVE
ncbi:MAG TPA: DUF1801 domain-containing protein [Myxococcales bacterium]|jgi:uncharacterized protein YdhG (YjbR/CyaY superfamily)